MELVELQDYYFVMRLEQEDHFVVLLFDGLEIRTGQGQLTAFELEECGWKAARAFRYESG